MPRTPRRTGERRGLADSRSSNHRRLPASCSRSTPTGSTRSMSFSAIAQSPFNHRSHAVTSRPAGPRREVARELRPARHGVPAVDMGTLSATVATRRDRCAAEQPISHEDLTTPKAGRRSQFETSGGGSGRREDSMIPAALSGGASAATALPWSSEVWISPHEGAWRPLLMAPGAGSGCAHHRFERWISDDPELLRQVDRLWEHADRALLPAPVAAAAVDEGARVTALTDRLRGGESVEVMPGGGVTTSRGPSVGLMRGTARTD
jgi:hypothetical protein